MKNTVIVILSLVCTFLIANTIGVFDFISLSNHDETIVYRQKREKAVNLAEKYKIVFLYSDDEPSAVGEFYGLKEAFEQLNKTAEKKYEFIVESKVKSLVDYNRTLQKYNDDFSVAAVIGPTHSGFTMSARALASMYAMPLLSSTTFRSERLAPLNFDMYQPMYPPLEQWVELIGRHVDQQSTKKLLIVSPQKGTFGDFFATIMERFSTTKLDLDGSYRLNYTEPLKIPELIDSIKFFSKDKDVGSILYTGDYEDFETFYELVQEYFPNATIYANDAMYVEEVFQKSYKNKFYLPRLEISVDDQYVQYFQQKYGIKPHYVTLTAQELVYSIDRTLKKMKKYDVVQFMNLFKEEVKNFNERNHLSLQLINYEEKN